MDSTHRYLDAAAAFGSCPAHEAPSVEACEAAAEDAPFWPSSRRLDEAALDRLFRSPDDHRGWTDRPLPAELLEELYALVNLGPVSANCSPARLVFVVSEAGKARLAPHLASGDRARILPAPACVIVGYDLGFAERLAPLFPHAAGGGDWFSRPEVAHEIALRNGALQGGYLILAARALGLEARPMSGFDAAGLTAEFFGGTEVYANFLCTLGHGADTALFPPLAARRGDEAATVL